MKATTVVLTVTLLLIATQVGAFAATSNRTVASRETTPHGGAQSPELTITVSPHNPPVTLPSSGGSFDFTVGIDNVGLVSAGFETWTLLEYPHGALVGPLLGPLEFQLPSAWSSSNDLSQELAADAPAGTYVFHVFFLDSLNGWITGATGNLLYTTNGGATWQHADIDTTAHLTDVVFADAQNGWVVGGDGLDGAIFRTTDGGASWYQQEAAGTQFIYGAFFTDASAGWAVGYNGTIVHTQTGGD